MGEDAKTALREQFQGKTVKVMQCLKFFLKCYLEKWWMPILVAIVLGVFVFIVNHVFPTQSLYRITLMFIPLLGVPVAGIISLARKRWVSGILNTFVFSFLLILLPLSFVAMLWPTKDNFADNLVIPNDLVVAQPKENLSAAEQGAKLSPQFLNECKAKNPTLVLWNGYSSGRYISVIWVNPGEPGRVYLRAYEAIYNTPLSEPELKEFSEDRMNWSTNPKQYFVSSKVIWIGEGDRGKPFAARFEVWFIPDSGKPERKLLEKVYKIEGWEK